MKNYIKYALATTFALSPLTTANAGEFRFQPPADVPVQTSQPSPLIPAEQPPVNPANPQLSSTGIQVVPNVLDPNAVMDPERDPEPFIEWYESDMYSQNWMTQYYKVIVVVNKAPSAAKKAPGAAKPRLEPGAPQTITVYQKQRNGQMKQVKIGYVSTGRDQIERGSNTGTGSMTGDAYFSQTHTGYFVPNELHIDHRSTRWEHKAEGSDEPVGSLMKHSVFFNNAEGEATHEFPAGTEWALGNTDSGACVRTDADMAYDLFWRVRYTGGQMEEGNCYSRPDQKVEKGNPVFEQEYAYVKSKLGELPSEWPLTPKMKQDGTGMVGGIDASGNFVPELRKGFQTLYIIFYKRDPSPNHPDPRDMNQVELQTAKGMYMVANASMWGTAGRQQGGYMQPGFNGGVCDDFQVGQPVAVQKEIPIPGTAGEECFDLDNASQFKKRNNGKFYSVGRTQCLIYKDFDGKHPEFDGKTLVKVSDGYNLVKTTTKTVMEYPEVVNDGTCQGQQLENQGGGGINWDPLNLFGGNNQQQQQPQGDDFGDFGQGQDQSTQVIEQVRPCGLFDGFSRPECRLFQ